LNLWSTRGKQVRYDLVHLLLRYRITELNPYYNPPEEREINKSPGRG